MSRAPRRWLDDADAPAGARDLLRSVGGPDPAARTRVWEAIQSSTAPAAAGAAAAGATGAKAAASGGLLALAGAKPAAVVGALLLAGTVAMRRPPTPAPHRPRPAATAAPTTVATAATAQEAPVAARIAAPIAAVIPDPVTPTAPAAVTVRRVARPMTVRVRAPVPTVVPVAPGPALTVDDELAAVASARALLGSDPAAALGALDALDARLDGGGVLAHERARYAVDALHRLGRDDEARTRADAFLAAHPTSTVAPALRALTARP